MVDIHCNQPVPTLPHRATPRIENRRGRVGLSGNAKIYPSGQIWRETVGDDER